MRYRAGDGVGLHELCHQVTVGGGGDNAGVLGGENLAALLPVEEASAGSRNGGEGHLIPMIVGAHPGDRSRDLGDNRAGNLVGRIPETPGPMVMRPGIEYVASGVVGEGIHLATRKGSPASCQVEPLSLHAPYPLVPA